MPKNEGGGVAAKIAAKAAAMAAVEGEANEPEDTAPSNGGGGTPINSAPAGADAAPPPATIEQATGEASSPADELSLRRSLLAEKLEEARARRQERKASRSHREHEGRTKQQLESELAAAQTERARLEKIGKGPFAGVLKELGRDPLQTFREMEAEAADINTPEGALRRLKSQTDETIAELNRKIDTLAKDRERDQEELKTERKTSAERELISRFETDFGRIIHDPAWRSLRVAYDDDVILAYAHTYRRDPSSLHAAAKLHKVRLTDPSRGFTMHEILTVLNAAQEDYEAKRKSREARLAGQSGDHADRSTVNGSTAPESRSTIGSDLASTRASGERRRLSRREKIDAEIDRLERQR